MKIIHCADLHLDSKMTTHLSGEQLRRRRAELLHTFTRMADYAAEQDVRAILICGDLFDSKNISAQAVNTVYETIRRHPGIVFFYLTGNHEEGAFVDALPSVPENLKIFGSEWTAYRLGTVLIEGTNHFTEVPQASNVKEVPVPLKEEATDKKAASAEAPVFAAKCFGNQEHLKEASTEAPAFVNFRDPDESAEERGNDDSESAGAEKTIRVDTFRIVALHGQLTEYGGADPETLNLQLLRNRGIDYLALGHIHAYKKGALEPRGIWCYPGALEGRGFDECGEHGFVLLDIDEASGNCSDTFIPFASRNLWELSVEIGGAASTIEIIEKMEAVIAAAEKIRAEDMVRVVLTGRIDVCAEKNMTQILTHFRDRFELFQLRDETSLGVNYLSFEHDASLKGELVRLLQKDPVLSEDEKAEIVRCGLQALSGEEFEF